MSGSKKIENLTALQIEDVEWALDAMRDYWADHDAEGITENEFDHVPETWTLPRIDGTTLILSDWNEINDDLAFRLGDQLVMMTDDQRIYEGDRTAAAHKRMLEKFADRIREVCGLADQGDAT